MDGYEAVIEIVAVRRGSISVTDQGKFLVQPRSVLDSQIREALKAHREQVLACFRLAQQPSPALEERLSNGARLLWELESSGRADQPDYAEKLEAFLKLYCAHLLALAREDSRVAA